MNQKVKFYRMSQLPQEGEIGGIYFITGTNPTLWLYTTDGWEQYTSYTEGLNIKDLENLEVSSLLTDSKSIVGAINELREFIETYMSLNYTTVEVTVSVLRSVDPDVYVGTEAVMTDLTSGHQESAVFNGNNYCSFLVNKGHQYKIELEKIPDYYRVINDKTKTANGSIQTYSIDVEYCADDRFIVLSNGHIYTWDEHQNVGSIPSGTTPEFIYMNNSILEENNATIYLPVQQLKGILPTSANWGGVNDEDIPELQNAVSYSTNTGEYDMERNTRIIINRYGSSCAAYIATQKTVTLNGQTYSGWLGTAEQYQQLLANNTELQGWFLIAGINKDFLSTGLAGWTSSEYQNTSGNVRARIIVSGSIQASPKVRTSGGISILPFYKDIH